MQILRFYHGFDLGSAKTLQAQARLFLPNVCRWPPKIGPRPESSAQTRLRIGRSRQNEKAALKKRQLQTCSLMSKNTVFWCLQNLQICGKPRCNAGKGGREWYPKRMKNNEKHIWFEWLSRCWKIAGRRFVCRTHTSFIFRLYQATQGGYGNSDHKHPQDPQVVFFFFFAVVCPKLFVQSFFRKFFHGHPPFTKPVAFTRPWSIWNEVRNWGRSCGTSRWTCGRCSRPDTVWINERW